MRTILVLVLALALAPLSVRAETTPPPSPEAADVRRIAEAIGLTDVTTGDVSVSGTSILARDVRGRLESGQAAIPGVSLRIGAVSIEGMRRDGAARSAPLVTVEDVDLGESRIARLAVSDLNQETPGGKLRYGSVQAEGIRFGTPSDNTMSVAGLRMTAEDWQDDMPARSALQLRGLALMGKVSEPARTMSGMPLTFDLDSRVSFDAAKGRLVLDEFNLWAGRTAVLRATASFSDVDMAKFAQARRELAGFKAPPVPMARPGIVKESFAFPIAMPLALAYGSVRLEGAEIRLEDSGLVKAVLGSMARSARSTPDEAAGSLVAMADAALAPRVSPAFKADTLGALRTFLADPRSLALKLSPGAGQGRLFQLFTGLSRGFVTARDLGATVRANQP